MARLDRRARLRFLPSQKPGLVEAVELSQDDVASAAWAVTPDGRLLRGAAAIGVGLDRLMYERISPLVAVLGLPVLRSIANGAYGAFAARRGRFGGKSECSIRWPQPLDAVSREEIRRRMAIGQGGRIE